jgi:3-phosphoshikimate 1-carboxyvinyltransferase
MADRASCPDFGPDELLIEGPLDYSGFAGDCSSFPDGFMTIAVLCARALGPSCLTGLRTLRVKETDRIAALANELRKVGCIVETGEDWIEITPPPREAQQRVATVRERSARNQPLADARGLPEPVIIETYNDHRMAMAFAVLGLVRRGISIRNPKCVAKSYPTFWKDFAKLYQ